MTTSPGHPTVGEDYVYEFPASFAQQRLWFLDQLIPASPAYNIDRSVHLKGPLDVAALEESIAEVVRRHESLRTTFVAVGGAPVQIVAPALAVPLAVVDLHSLPGAERAARARDLTSAEAQRPFDLARGPLLRATLLRLGSQEHLLLLTIHHIVADEWSLGVLLRELAALYTAHATGQPAQLPALPLQYADYAQWQREWLQGEELEAQLAYWRGQLAGAPPVLDLTTDRPRPPLQVSRGAIRRFEVAQATSQKLRQLGQQEGATLYMTLLAAFQTLLSRYTGQDDLVVGAPIAGRMRTELEGLIGFFVNTLALRVDLSGDPSFRELLHRVRMVTLEAYAHQDLPFERLVEELHPQRNLSYNPLFQVMFVLQNVPRSTEDFVNLTVEFESGNTGTAKLDLTVFMAEQDGGLAGEWEYNTDLFEAGTIERLAEHFQTLLDGIVADPDRRLSELPLFPEALRLRLLYEWNATQADYPRDRCVHQLFEEQVARTPGAVAVVCGKERLTYEELDRQANQLARHLRALGVGPEVLVGLCAERSLEMVVGLLGILKAGGAYVPLDPAYPTERLAFMLRDARIPMLLAQQRLVERLPQQAAVVYLDTNVDAVTQEGAVNRVRGIPEGADNGDAMASAVSAENLIYVMYTSGSSGQPKGVLAAHRATVNRLHWMWQTYPFRAGEVCCQKTALSFVDSVWEVFGPLLQGVPTVIIPDHVVKDPPQFIRTLAEHDVTRMVLVPSLLRVLLDTYPDLQARLPALTFWVTSGEALPGDLLHRFREHLPQSRLVNLYGSSEVAADVTWYDTTGRDDCASVPIGRPIANSQIYLLDGHLQPVPVGVPGEVYVGGAGLARGYLNRPDLTTERFIADPFGQESGARLYKTGDRARYLPDGTIEYLGRLDHQVKVRGMRVELGEIEAMLGKHPAVREGVLTLREDTPGDQRLVGYVVLHEAVTVAELKGYLKKHLPEYMVPATFVTLDTLPLMPNGKIDRSALPKPDLSRLAAEDAFVAPRTPDEEIVAGIWASVLGLERIGIHDNFFEFGGHSLLATQVVSRIRDTFQVDVPLLSLFEAPTVVGLAAAIDKIKASGAAQRGPALRPVSREAYRTRVSSMTHDG